MMTLITGKPGSGKTAYTVNMLMSGEFQGRPLYVDGIPDLKIEHFDTNDEQRVDNWQDWLPDGAVMVIDEAQRIMRPRPVGSKVPLFVQAFETHRHRGADFIIITQHPNLIDSNVRRLIGRHIDIRTTALGRYLHEWAEAKDPDSSADRNTAAKRKFTLPKKTFDQYKSATVHVKQKHRLPWQVYLLMIIVPLMLWKGWSVYGRITAQMHGGEASQAQGEVHSARGGQAGQATPAPAGGAATPQPAQVKPAGSTPADYLPRVANQPETAPLYDNIRQVQSMEWPAACIANARKCNCYSDQATLIKTVDEMTCRDIVENGRFNPYQPPRYAAKNSVPPPQMVSPPPAEPSAAQRPKVATIGKRETEQSGQGSWNKS